MPMCIYCPKLWPVKSWTAKAATVRREPLSASAVQDQVNDTLAQLLVDRLAGEQQPAVQRCDQGLQKQAGIGVRPQLAARDASLDDGT